MNQTYVERVIVPFKELVLQDDIDNIPNILINPDSDLNLVSSNVASLAVTIKNNETDDEQIVDIFKSIEEYFSDDRNTNRLAVIDQSSKSFASLLEQGYGVINNKIVPTVEDIKAKIAKKYRENLILAKADTLISSSEDEPNESNFSFIDWSLLSGNNKADIIDAACTNANINVKNLSSVNLSYILAKINFAKEFTNVEIPKELKATIIDKLILVFDQYKLTNDQVDFYWRIITDKIDYNNFCNDVVYRINDVKRTAANVLDLINVVAKFDIFTEFFKSNITDSVNIDTLQDIASNVDVVIKTMYAIKYWLLIVKDIRFKDKLIITDTIINSEAYDDFIREGKSITDIYKYLKAFFYNTPIPNDGILTSSIIKSDSDSRLTKINETIKSNEAFIKAKCLLEAYQLAVAAFANDPENVNIFPALNDANFRYFFIKTANANASGLQGNIDNVDNILFLTIVNMFYSDSLIGTLFKFLGKSFSNLVENEDDINDDNILQSQCSAVIDLLVDFMFESNLCVAG